MATRTGLSREGQLVGGRVYSRAIAGEGFGVSCNVTLVRLIIGNLFAYAHGNYNRRRPGTPGMEGAAT